MTFKEYFKITSIPLLIMMVLSYILYSFLRGFSLYALFFEIIIFTTVFIATFGMIKWIDFIGH